jgi:isochorismate hydrolase
MVKLAKIVGCEVAASEQKASVFGPTVPEVGLETLGPQLIGKYDKTLFSMVTKDLSDILAVRPHIESAVVFGIESHICVLQTCLDLLSRKLAVYVLADGVSSINRQEVPHALAVIKQSGGHVTTSESLAFRLMRDSAAPEFKAFSALIKEEKDNTKRTAEVLSWERSAL